MKSLLLLSVLGTMLLPEQGHAWGRRDGHHSRQRAGWVYCANDRETCRLPQGEEFSYQVRYVDQGDVMTISMPAMDVPCNKMQFTRSYSDGAARTDAYCEYFDPRQ